MGSRQVPPPAAQAKRERFVVLKVEGGWKGFVGSHE